LAAFGGAIAALARDTAPPEPARPVFGADLDLVNVTIVVRDEKGRLVQDLASEDFTVFEDGRPQKALVFGSPAALGGEQPLEDDNFNVNLGLLLDTSESMLKELRLSQMAATRFLENIPRARDLITIFFDQDIRISRYNSENQQGLVQRIMETKGSGNTALYDAITVYMSRVTDTPGRKILVLLTDGEDTTSATSLTELLNLVRASPVTIYPVAFTGSFGMGSNRSLTSRGVLSQLAEISGGAIFVPGASKDLAVIYAAILDELKAQYVLGYVSDNPKADGRFRRLRVSVRGKDLKVRHRQGYVVPKG
ncbi:MAG TPA: VWA domain-containing protein, partial [Vicinamibacteria bacterium]|nr:VWA domain-containing protein [Vicinamibacteria bacterium]